MERSEIDRLTPGNDQYSCCRVGTTRKSQKSLQASGCVWSNHFSHQVGQRTAANHTKMLFSLNDTSVVSNDVIAIKEEPAGTYRLVMSLLGSRPAGVGY